MQFKTMSFPDNFGTLAYVANLAYNAELSKKKAKAPLPGVPEVKQLVLDSIFLGSRIKYREGANLITLRFNTAQIGSPPEWKSLQEYLNSVRKMRQLHDTSILRFNHYCSFWSQVFGLPQDESAVRELATLTSHLVRVSRNPACDLKRKREQEKD